MLPRASRSNIISYRVPGMMHAMPSPNNLPFQLTSFIGRAPFISFEEARRYVQGMGLRSCSAW